MIGDQPANMGSTKMKYRLRTVAVAIALLCAVPLATGCDDAGTGTSTTASQDAGADRKSVV